MSGRSILVSAIAVGSHAALLLALHGRFAGRTSDPTAEVTREIEMVEEPATSVASPLAEATPGRGALEAFSPGRAAGVAAAATPTPRAREGESIAPPAFVFSPFAASPVNLGLQRGTLAAAGQGRAAAGEPGRADPVEPPAEADTHHTAEEALADRSRDVELGLGPEGPILTALRDATYASFAALHGSATFRATIDTDGHVASLRVVDSKDEGWADVSLRAREALAGKTANLRGRDGAIVSVLVTSATVEAPKGLLGKAGAILFLEPGELARKQQRSVHVHLLSVR